MERRRDLADREVRAVPKTVNEAIDWIKSDTDVMSERLARRYDPGAALAESANRALVAKAKARAEEEGYGLSSIQLKTLEYQKRDINRRIRQA